MPKTRVFFVDDSADIVDLYKRMINKQPDMECVGSSASTVGLEDALAGSRADVAVVDLVGPGRDAFEGIRAAAAACPDCRVIAFSGHDDQDTLDRALTAGAWTLVSKHDHPMKLLEEVRRATQSSG